MSTEQVQETPLGQQQNLVRIRVFLNKDLDKTDNFDTSKDLYVDIEYDEREISLSDLEIDLNAKFTRKGKEISVRLKDKSYEIEFFSYHENVNIEDDDDLITEIEEIFPDEEYDDPNTDKMVALRIVFAKSANTADKEEKNDDIQALVKPIITKPIIASQQTQQPVVDNATVIMDKVCDEKEQHQENHEEKDDILSKKHTVVTEQPGIHDKLSDEKKIDQDIKQQTEEEIKGIPMNFLDPITKKIMVNPTMIVSSMQVYDGITIKRWIESKRCYDPVTGIPMCLGGWPLLLQRRYDIKEKIEKFIQNNSSHNYNRKIFSKKDEKSIKWELLFQVYDKNINDKYQEIVHDQSELRVQAKQLLKPIQLAKNGDGDELGVGYEDSIILESDIPVVCIMGPSRNGKSTLVNGILGVKYACETSVKANVSLTKGAWITKYSTKPNPQNGEIYICQHEGINNDETDEKSERKEDFVEFYLIDMEGLSHGVTTFTRRLFYACYAASNLMIWNDKNVASDEFKNLMNELKQQMKCIANSDKKPAFLYLERDAGDYQYNPYDSLDEYINKDASFEWFRKMNIFSSLSGYELDRPSKDKDNKKTGLNFLSKAQNRQLLQPLIKEISRLCQSSRFASNMMILKQQIKHINKSAGLSMTEKVIIDNEVLRLFLISSKGDELRKRDMIYVACEFDWKYKKLQKKFNEEMSKVKQILAAINVSDKQALGLLEQNKSEIYQRVKNKAAVNKNENMDISFGTFMGYFMATSLTMATIGFAALAWREIADTTKNIIITVYSFGSRGTSVYGYVPPTKWKKTRDTSSFAENNYMKYVLGETD